MTFPAFNETESDRHWCYILPCKWFKSTGTLKEQKVNGGEDDFDTHREIDVIKIILEKGEEECDDEDGDSDFDNEK
jgi:hypothetical protein